MKEIAPDPDTSGGVLGSSSNVENRLAFHNSEYNYAYFKLIIDIYIHSK